MKQSITIQKINNKFHVQTTVNGFVIYTDDVCETKEQAQKSADLVTQRENTYNMNQVTNYK